MVVLGVILILLF